MARARVAGLVARLGLSLALTLLVLLLAVSATGMIVAALWLWLATFMTTSAAALICGMLLFVMAGLAALIGRLILPSRPITPVASYPAGTAGGQPLGMAGVIGSELGAAGSIWMKEHAPQVVLAAATAGFLVGVSPRLRAALWRLLR